jgi:hypothetical protein
LWPSLSKQFLDYAVDANHTFIIAGHLMVVVYLFYLLKRKILNQLTEEEVIDDHNDLFEYEEVPVDEDFVAPGKKTFYQL